MTRRSQRLRNSDVRAIFHLLGEIVELGRDPGRWRLYMIEELTRMVGGRVALGCEHFYDAQHPTESRLVGATECGWEPSEQKRFHDHLNAGDMVHDPMHPAVGRLLFRSFTRRRRDFIPDEVWYGSPVVDPLRRMCNVDDTLHSRRRLPHKGWAHAITLMKSWGDAPFTIRDRLLVNLFHRELGRLWSRVDGSELAALPPRLRQTLNLIFSGYSEKEIGAELNVSPHTAHDFARRLYRHFDVSGRGDLLTNVACRRLLFRPALSPAYYVQDRVDAAGSFPARS
jgi:DNA-binding CsgD family transcriptional regulator